MAKQLEFFEKQTREHGGELSIGKRRGKRPISKYEPMHITMKSYEAMGPRDLHRNRRMVRAQLIKWARKFRVKVYHSAVCSNHIHLAILGTDRKLLQHFFRVFTGQVAQIILNTYPQPATAGKPAEHCRKNQRTFWAHLMWSRVLTWGRHFKQVVRYIKMNAREASGEQPYTPRKAKRKKRGPDR